MSSAPQPPLEAWAEQQAKHSASKLGEAISATALLRERDFFGQTVRPAKGSVLASPTSANPDYFFHWLRDSAAVMEAVRLLIRKGENAEAWTQRFNEFVAFSTSLRTISGHAFLKSHEGFRDHVFPNFLQYVRSDADIAAVEGERVLGEARYNADGTLDFICWNRPQHDGPAARALTCMRFWDDGVVDGDEKLRLKELIHRDLDYTAYNAGEPSFDIWEEDLAQHYYTVLIQFAALAKGTLWAEAEVSLNFAAHLRDKALGLAGLLQQFWSEESGFIRSRLAHDGIESEKALDFAVILGVLHAGIEAGPHSVEDPRVRATMTKLGELFRREYAINRDRETGLAYGRYKRDNYVSGGAYYFSTFGAAEYFYRLAAAVPAEAAKFIGEGDAILSRTRTFIPASGALSEQFDQTSGEQTSASDLTWSYACFITAWEARQAALKSGRSDA